MKPDRSVIQGCINGDERAYYALFSCCYGTMMGICMRYLGEKEDANGAVNTAFLKIINSLERWDDTRPFEAWAKTITVNTVIDVCRQQKVQQKNMPISPLEMVQDSWIGQSENYADHSYNAEILERMILALPDMHRQVFNMFAIDGYNHKEIAELLNCSVSASKWYLHQARKLLQDQLKDQLTYEKKYQHG